jgi:nicotinamide mononucleotide transporter
VSVLGWLLEGTIGVGGSALLVREVVGNGFGLASALLGMRRVVAAWPVGIAGNIVLFTVFVSGILDKPQVHDLWGQAGRQVFFLAVSVYGWWRWRRSERAGGAPDGRAIVPRWATPTERSLLVAAAAGMLVVFVPVLEALDSWGPLADAWILSGSILATFAMARGWVDFWLIWILVDVVGVPLAFAAGYYPSGVLYLVYGLFCLWGFWAWRRAGTRLGPDLPERTEVAAR